jgi:hypothetical protein
MLGTGWQRCNGRAIPPPHAHANSQYRSESGVLLNRGEGSLRNLILDRVGHLNCLVNLRVGTNRKQCDDCCQDILLVHL